MDLVQFLFAFASDLPSLRLSARKLFGRASTRLGWRVATALAIGGALTGCFTPYAAHGPVQMNTCLEYSPGGKHSPSRVYKNGKLEGTGPNALLDATLDDPEVHSEIVSARRVGTVGLGLYGAAIATWFSSIATLAATGKRYAIPPTQAMIDAGDTKTRTGIHWNAPSIGLAATAGMFWLSGATMLLSSRPLEHAAVRLYNEHADEHGCPGREPPPPPEGERPVNDTSYLY